MKIRLPCGAAVLGAITLSSVPALITGCSARSVPLTTGFGAQTATPLVMPAANDATRAASMLVATDALDGRLDATLGAPERTVVTADFTDISVLDQQFTWNGRVYDSYVNVRRTYRQQSR